MFILKGPNPVYRGDWNGNLLSLDGASTEDFTPEDVSSVVISGYDGEKSAGVLQLRDGRIACWETYSDVTGDGFNRDAYGGDADIYFCNSLKTAIMMGLSAEGRHLCGCSLSHER